MHFYRTLGVTPADDDETIRQAYLAAVRKHPPERDPEAFQRITNAYALIDTADKRIRRELAIPESKEAKDHFDTPMEAVSEFLHADIDPVPPAEEDFYAFLRS